QVHFHVGADRPERLFFQRTGAAVPNEDLPEGGVDDRGGAAAELLHVVADAARLAITPAIGRAVARCARQDVGGRQAGVEVKLLSPRRLLDRVGVCLRGRGRLPPAVLGLVGGRRDGGGRPAAGGR